MLKIVTLSTTTKTSVNADSIVRNVSAFLLIFNLLTNGIITAELVPHRADAKNNDANIALDPVPQALSSIYELIE